MARHSGLCGYAGYGYCASHSRRCSGCNLLLVCACDGTAVVTDKGLSGQAAKEVFAGRRPGPDPDQPSPECMT